MLVLDFARMEIAAESPYEYLLHATPLLCDGDRVSYASDGNVEGSLSAGFNLLGVGTLVGRESVQNVSHEQISGASVPKQSMVVRMLVP